jgi:hypothetical protein
VTAGARRDRGEFDAAVSVLEGSDLRSRSRAEWVARLRYAYADALLAAGRNADALEWFHRAAACGRAGAAPTPSSGPRRCRLGIRASPSTAT